jgi:hypothetical protein
MASNGARFALSLFHYRNKSASLWLKGSRALNRNIGGGHTAAARTTVRLGISLVASLLFIDEEKLPQ